MSGNELASDQPEVFEFSEENQFHRPRFDPCGNGALLL